MWACTWGGGRGKARWVWLGTREEASKEGNCDCDSRSCGDKVTQSDIWWGEQGRRVVGFGWPWGCRNPHSDDNLSEESTRSHSHRDKMQHLAQEVELCPLVPIQGMREDADLQPDSQQHHGSSEGHPLSKQPLAFSTSSTISDQAGKAGVAYHSMSRNTFVPTEVWLFVFHLSTAAASALSHHLGRHPSTEQFRTHSEFFLLGLCW